MSQEETQNEIQDDDQEKEILDQSNRPIRSLKENSFRK